MRVRRVFCRNTGQVQQPHATWTTGVKKTFLCFRDTCSNRTESEGSGFKNMQNYIFKVCSIHIYNIEMSGTSTLVSIRK